MKYDLKTKAIVLRKEGLAYNEILKLVPVSKSTLSLWLRSVHLAKAQKQLLTSKKRAAIMKGGQARRTLRVKSTEEIFKQSLQDITSIGFDKKALFLVGIALYWAEGAKQKEHNVSQPVCFSNSDPQMLLIFVFWLDTICNIKKEDIQYDLYIHVSADIESALNYWSSVLKIDSKSIRVRYKKNTILSFRKNREIDYHGLIRIVVPRSTNLNRQISGWINGICTFCPVV